MQNLIANFRQGTKYQKWGYGLICVNWFMLWLVEPGLAAGVQIAILVIDLKLHFKGKDTISDLIKALYPKWLDYAIIGVKLAITMCCLWKASLTGIEILPYLIMHICDGHYHWNE